MALRVKKCCSMRTAVGLPTSCQKYTVSVVWRSLINGRELLLAAGGRRTEKSVRREGDRKAAMGLGGRMVIILKSRPDAGVNETESRLLVSLEGGRLDNYRDAASPADCFRPGEGGSARRGGRQATWA